jgi:D-psicose/D-tagatose/L-ribulose 3-epimerase
MLIGPFHDMERKRIEEIKKVAQDNNIELTFNVALDRETDPSAKNESIRKNAVEYIKKCLELVHTFDGTMFGGVNYGVWNQFMEKGETDRRPYLDQSVKSVKEIAKTAENYGIYYMLEVINRFEHFMLNTCEEALAYIDEVGSDFVKVHLDIFHMNIEEDDLVEPILTAGDRLGHFHFRENNGKAPGEGHGHIPWDDIAAALKKINYQGRIVLEPFVKPGGEIGETLRIWRDMCPGDMDEYIKKSLEFIKAKF